MRFGLQSVGLGVAVAVAAAALAVGASAASGGAATLSVRGSDYGTVLAGPGGLVVYMFAPDRTSKSTCYGTCARFWDPVLTKGRPIAGPGVKANLLGTTTRKDGRVQVTYNGHPLYFDNMTGESNAAGEIGCQHLNINGGIWLIMKPNGQPNRSNAKPHHE
jgi:predicted lipoprotein with Yx(FWY)xxD motif